MIHLKGGAETFDPRLDRIKQFDERSRSFGILEAVDTRTPRSYTWEAPLILDQGREGACVGFALTHELAARPGKVPGLGAAFAQSVYHRARRIDPWPGEDYEGTSVLAGIKVLHREGWFKSYRWAFGLEQLILGVGYNGPAVIGINWYSGMYEPGADGYIAPTGRLVGGHCILVNGVSIRKQRFKLPNSWGTDWGPIGGFCYMSFESMGRLLSEDGEAAFLEGRRTSPVPPAA